MTPRKATKAKRERIQETIALLEEAIHNPYRGNFIFISYQEVEIIVSCLKQLEAEGRK